MPAPSRMFESRFPARTPESIRSACASPLAWGFALASILAASLSGCATRQAAKSPPPPIPPPPPAIVLPVSATPAGPRSISISQPSTPALPSKKPPTPAAIVSEKLADSFEVLADSADSLRVSKKNSPPTQRPSLFEESILLGKIRGVLAPSASRSSRTAHAATFKNGIAAIAIPPSTQPGTAALAIAKILSLGGVNEVHASFPSTE